MDGGDVQSFAVRLGYDPAQVRRLVDRMGADITQNELLSELVKIKGSLDTRNGCDLSETPGLRHIVVDGANIFSNYDNKKSYGLPIQICVRWFRERGHKDITVFIPPSWKEFYFTGIEKDDTQKLEIMYTAEEDKAIWSKAVILKFVLQVDGILVSNDNYEKLVKEFPEYLAVVEKRLLMYSFVKNRFMPPDDPLGRMGPTLDKFLQKSPIESLQSPGAKNPNKNVKGSVKGQRSNSPKYAKRSLSRLHYPKRRDIILPNELIRSNSDQAIKYGSLPSITEAPITDLLQNISLETHTSDPYSNAHHPVLKNISDPTEVKCHVSSNSSTPPGSFNGSLKHKKVARKNCDFNRLTQDAAYWRNQPAERPFEDIKSDDILRSHFSVPDISYGAINDGQDFYGMCKGSSNYYSSTPNFWTNTFGEGQAYYDSSKRCLINFHSVYAVRAKIHYHMSAIFPQEQVDTVFRLHPDEVNPRELCSEIIRLFPNV